MLAAQLVEIFAMSFAKLSSGFLIERVAPQTRRVKAGHFAMVGAWTVFSVFAIAFRCGVDTEWASPTHRCSSSGLLIAVIGSNIVTDFVLAFWLFPTLLALSLNKEKRFTALVLFGSRAMYVLAGGRLQVLTI